MASEPFVVAVDESALEANPAVTAALRGEGAAGRKKRFDDREGAVEWCERLTRIGSKELELVPGGEGMVDARIAAVDATLGDDLGEVDDDEGGFDDFLDDAF